MILHYLRPDKLSSPSVLAAAPAAKRQGAAARTETVLWARLLVHNHRSTDARSAVAQSGEMRNFEDSSGRSQGEKSSVRSPGEAGNQQRFRR
jgi:hypothetical protein